MSSGARAAVGEDVVLACRALLFDCDGVLVDSIASVERSWSRWALAYGLEPDAVISIMHGRRAADTVAALVAEDGRPEAAARIDGYELEDAYETVAVPGAAELVASLPAGAWAVVTSGTSSLARARLAAAGIRPPQVTVTADDIVVGKPAPEGYLTAARGLGVRPEEAVVLEDSDSGIRAARAAGVRAVVGVGAPALGFGADVVVADLRGLTWSPDGLRVPGDARLGRAAELPPTERLAVERTAAVEAVAELSREVQAIVAASADSNADDEHDPEGATVAYERARVQAALDGARTRVAQLDAALDRVSDATYGRCQRCGRPIAAARLEALPAATRCLACASAAS